MTTWLAQIHVMLKDGVVDPQGITILDALHQLRFTDVARVRVGKQIEILLDAPDEAAARSQVEAMCVMLLANPVIERFQYIVTESVPLHT